MVDKVKTVKFLVVLAGKVEKFNKLSLRTISQLEKAFKLFQEGEYDFFFVSGGKLNPPKIQDKSAAILMKEWLLGKGIDKGLIFSESESEDIFQNIEGVRDEIKKRIEKRNKNENFFLTILSDQERMKRIKLILKGKGNVEYEEVFFHLNKVELFKEKVFYLLTLLNPHGKDLINKSLRGKKYI